MAVLFTKFIPKKWIILVSKIDKLFSVIEIINKVGNTDSKKAT
jgi:hypothetical protein